MSTLPELMKRDSVSTAWFWVTSESTGPHAEREKYDVVFTRELRMVVGGGYFERRTLYVTGVQTSEAYSRRNNGGRTVKGDPVETLGNLLSDALSVDNNPTFREWAEEQCCGSSMPAWEQYAMFEQDTALRDRLRVWLGDDYDEYMKAAQD